MSNEYVENNIYSEDNKKNKENIVEIKDIVTNAVDIIKDFADTLNNTTFSEKKWRDNIHKAITAIHRVSGIDYDLIYNRAYARLEERACCDLHARKINKEKKIT